MIDNNKNWSIGSWEEACAVSLTDAQRRRRDGDRQRRRARLKWLVLLVLVLVILAVAAFYVGVHTAT